MHFHDIIYKPDHLSDTGHARNVWIMLSFSPRPLQVYTRAVGSKNVVVRLAAYNNERATVVNVESYKSLTNSPRIAPFCMRTSIFDDLYLKSDQKVVRLSPDQPDRLLRPWICIHDLYLHVHSLNFSFLPHTHAPSLQPLGAEGPTYPDMAKEAVSNALSDAGLPYEAIQAAVRYLSTNMTICF